MLRPVQFSKFNFMPQAFINGVNFHDFVNNKFACRIVSENPLMHKTGDIKIQRKILPHSSKLDVIQSEDGVNVVLQKPVKSTNSATLSNETSGRKIKTALSSYFDEHYNKNAELNLKKEKAKNLQQLVDEYEKTTFSHIRKENQKLMLQDAKRDVELFRAEDAAKEARLNKEWAEDKADFESYYSSKEYWEDFVILD